MADSDATFVQPSRPVTPTPPAPATSTTYAPSQLPGITPLDYTAHLETGDRSIPQQIHDINSQQGHPAQGNWQFIVPTWRRQAPKAGVDLNQYPTPMSAPRSVQAQVAAVTPGTEFGPRTQAGLRAKFPGIDLTKPLGYYGGTAGGSGNPAPPSAPPPPAAAPPPPATVGGLIGSLNTPPSPGQKSIADNLGGMFPQPQAQQPPPMNLAAQQAAGMGNIRQAQIAQQAQPMMAAIQQRAAQPLSWNSRPPGSMIGQQPMPGTTLNSMGDFYGQ